MLLWNFFFYSAQNELGGLTDFRPDVYPDGSVYYNFPSVIKSLCKVDVTYFPFDVQQCEYPVFYSSGTVSR
jgi:nicotinic acetylcholine receptor alpha-9/nicotinic acetylcholine receptor